MLGGNVIIAMIRYVISVAGVILLFSQMSQFRFDRKKTVIGYALFTVVLVSGYSRRRHRLRHSIGGNTLRFW